MSNAFYLIWCQCSQKKRLNKWIGLTTKAKLSEREMWVEKVQAQIISSKWMIELGLLRVFFALLCSCHALRQVTMMINHTFISSDIFLLSILAWLSRNSSARKAKFVSDQRNFNGSFVSHSKRRGQSRKILFFSWWQRKMKMSCCASLPVSVTVISHSCRTTNFQQNKAANFPLHPFLSLSLQLQISPSSLVNCSKQFENIENHKFLIFRNPWWMGTISLNILFAVLFAFEVCRSHCVQAVGINIEAKQQKVEGNYANALSFVTFRVVNTSTAIIKLILFEQL